MEAVPVADMAAEPTAEADLEEPAEDEPVEEAQGCVMAPIKRSHAAQ